MNLIKRVIFGKCVSCCHISEPSSNSLLLARMEEELASPSNWLRRCTRQVPIRKQSDSTKKRWQWVSECWAIPTRPQSSTTWQNFTVSKAGIQKRSHWCEKRWRFGSEYWAKSIPTQPEHWTT